jgi:hypothetical protein
MSEAGDPIADEETDAAAKEAGAIGGSEPDYGTGDPAEKPLAEAGEGESEGFEQAEDALRDQAENFDGHRSPLRDQMTPEAESDEAGAEYAEADQASDPDDA